MRQFVPSLAIAITVSLALQTPSSATATPTTTCKTLADEDSKFAFFLKTFVVHDDSVMNDLRTLVQPLDRTAPWLSTCLASIDPMTVYATVSLSSGFAACNASLSNYAMFENTTFTDNAVRTSLCPFYGTTLLPCLQNVFVQALVDAMASAGGCCDGLTTQIKTQFGADLKTLAGDVLAKIGAAMCTVKTFKNAAGATTSEACLTSLYNSFWTPATMEFLLPLVQLPTDQACKAVTGQPFTTTLGESVQFNWMALGVENVGICYEPLSDLFHMIGAYPLMAALLNGMAVADAFTPSKCLPVESVLQYIQANDSLPMQIAHAIDDIVAVGGMKTLMNVSDMDMNFTTLLPAFLTELQANLPSVCFHVATGQQCDYHGATTTLRYQSTPTTTQVTSASSDTLLLSSAAMMIASTASFSPM